MGLVQKTKSHSATNGSFSDGTTIYHTVALGQINEKIGGKKWVKLQSINKQTNR